MTGCPPAPVNPLMTGCPPAPVNPLMTGCSPGPVNPLMTGCPPGPRQSSFHLQFQTWPVVWLPVCTLSFPPPPHSHLIDHSFSSFSSPNSPQLANVGYWSCQIDSPSLIAGMAGAVLDAGKALAYRGTRLGFVPQTVTVGAVSEKGGAGGTQQSTQTAASATASSASAGSGVASRRSGGATRDGRAASPSTHLLMHFLECDGAAPGSGSGSGSGSGLVQDLLQLKPKLGVYPVVRGSRQLDLLHKVVALRNSVMAAKSGEPWGGSPTWGSSFGKHGGVEVWRCGGRISIPVYW